ncbi:hypothetical protein [aff. Roholtiella sp. LEGE 12411]|uniref:hypothetical protein n=1 Tax=aff. Roholtiella sp. LEGE 12411 TaxID=1828822 RepID=UPI001880041E|nr:hypothetical protein [aff. Roholtiella sp. LEGE 12411]MBE9036571.1 hypothetical protein [aff. Roholtiella sp. LEGE 12411]
MQAINNDLFTEITSEESATVSGGTAVNFGLNQYLFILGAGTVFGVPGLTAEETNFAFEKAVAVESPALSL